jgi:diguanylate cyclase (GGDEF)-like protein
MAAFSLQVSRQLVQCRRQGGRLALIWIEAELHGRPASSWPVDARQELMQALSRRLRNRVRSTDEVVQVGEDSFAVLLPLAGGTEAAMVEDRLQQALKGAYGLDGLLVHASLSMGSATFPEAGRQATDLAETARRNCIAARAALRLATAQTSSHSLRM